MANPATPYTRLPGRGRRLSGRFFSGEVQRLYLAPDHVLVLRQTGYEETSKRFFLRDIQAITIQSNADRTIIAGLLLALIVLFAGIGAIASANEGGSPFDLIMYGIAGIIGITLAVHLALGPSCTARLHTAVQVEELTALRRFRVARKCLGIVVPQIEAVQGPWPDSAGASHLVAAGSVRASASAKRFRSATPPKVVGRGVHAAAFALSILFGLGGVAELLYQGTAKNVLDAILLAAAMMLRLVAAIRQSNSTLPKQTRDLTWTLFILNSLAFIVAIYMAMIIATMESTVAGEPPPIITNDVATLLVNRSPWMGVFTAVWGGLSLVLGVFGLLSIRGYTLVPPDAPNNDGAAQP